MNKLPPRTEKEEKKPNKIYSLKYWKRTFDNSVGLLGDDSILWCYQGILIDCISVVPLLTSSPLSLFPFISFPPHSLFPFSHSLPTLSLSLSLSLSLTLFFPFSTLPTSSLFLFPAFSSHCLTLPFLSFPPHYLFLPFLLFPPHYLPPSLIPSQLSFPFSHAL